MKRKVKITFEINIDYDVKETQQLSKDFDCWLKEWCDNVHPVPILFKKFKNKPSIELDYKSIVSHKIMKK